MAFKKFCSCCKGAWKSFSDACDRSDAWLEAKGRSFCALFKKKKDTTKNERSKLVNEDKKAAAKEVEICKNPSASTPSVKEKCPTSCAAPKTEVSKVSPEKISAPATPLKPNTSVPAPKTGAPVSAPKTPPTLKAKVQTTSKKPR